MDDGRLYFASSSLHLLDNDDALLLNVVPILDLQMQTTVSIVLVCGAMHVILIGVVSAPSSLLFSRGGFLLMNGLLLFVAMSSGESSSSFHNSHLSLERWILEKLTPFSYSNLLDL